MDITAVKTAKGWTLVRANGKRVAIEGEKTWSTKALLEAALKAKGLRLKGNEVVKPKPVGRPRTYTPEEYVERRREQSKAYWHSRREEDPEADTKRGQEYRKANAEKQKEYRRKSYEKRMERLHSDPEYKAKYNEYQRQWRANRKEGK